MTAVPAPTLLLPREEWPDADFDLPEGAPISSPSDKDDEDWDVEPLSAILAPKSEITFPLSGPSMINIRPPIQTTVAENDDEGVSTIKASAMSTITPKTAAKPTVESVEENFEDDFSLPSELTQLSLAPLSLSHRASKNSLEWGEKDNSSSSQSSDAYSTLGFAEASSSSNSTSSASLPDTETEEDDDELEGIVIPSTLFESGQGASQLKKILECRKTSQPKDKPTQPRKIDPEDDFETGLVLSDDVDLSPSRLVVNIHVQRSVNHSSIHFHKQSVLRPPSRAKFRSKSPSIPPTSSVKQLQRIRVSPSPPLYPPSRSQNFQALGASFQTASSLLPPSNTNIPKTVSLRGQKSCTGLKPPSPPSTKKVTRKASLSSLFEASNALASGSTSRPLEPKPARYEGPTAASRAKSHKTSTSRMHDFKVPPTRPCTPSSNTAALRLTMPTQSRLRSRPALSQVFGTPATPSQESPVPRSTSPLPPRPPSSSSLHVPILSRSQTQPLPLAPKLLRRPKRLRTYGNGTELDHIEDLPTDRDKEVRYRVQPNGYGNRIPGATYASKAAEKSKPVDKGTARRKGGWEGAVTQEPSTLLHARSTNTLRRTTTRIDTPEATPGVEWSPKKKKMKSTPSPLGKRKPTLISNLGRTSAPKVVGEMKWNPQTLRWEGNEQILRDFDAAIGTSIRPALITHLTTSFIGSLGGSFSSGARVVGDMAFDPSRMCWVSTLPPEQDEPDVFANLADDEEDEWDEKGATIRANVPRVSDVSATSSSSDTQIERTSPAPSHARTTSESSSDRGSRASMVVCNIDDAFIASCRRAEERHRVQMKSWKTSCSQREASLASDRSHLYEIRALATRQY